MWKSLHIYYYDNYDQLISQLIPTFFPDSSFFQSSSCQIESFYFTRHWIGGPHIRLNFKIQKETNWESLLKLITTQIERFLDLHPSKSTLVDDNWYKNTSALLKLEHIQWTEDKIKLHPDNSWELHEYEIRNSMYGGEKGARLAEDFYSDTTSFICELISSSLGNPDDRINKLLQMMVALVRCTHINFYISYRSHFEGHMNALSNRDVIKEAIHKLYINKKERYTFLVKETLQNVEEILAGERSNDWLLTRWIKIITKYKSLLTKEVQNGLLPFQADPNYVPKYSNFHKNAYSNQVVQDFSKTNVFQVQRFLFSFMYNLFNLAGMTPLKRAYLCYFAAESIETVTGKDWETILSETVDAKELIVDRKVH